MTRQVDAISGNTTTGLSSQMLDVASSASNASLRVVGITPGPDNAWGDNFVIVRAVIAQHQYGQIRVSGTNYTPIAV